MIFEEEPLTKTEKRQGYFLRRWRSTGGKWEMFHVQRIFGVAVGYGRYRDGGVERVYCAGDSQVGLILLTNSIRGILAKVPENIEPSVLKSYFPVQEHKPILNNIILISHLARLSDGEIPLKAYNIPQYSPFDLEHTISSEDAWKEYEKAISQ